jgi:hypothetical protein
MSLKSRIAKLSRSREQTLIRIIGGFPSDEYPHSHLDKNQIPYTPRHEGESERAWVARLEALGRELYPRAEIVTYGGLPSRRSGEL